MIHIAQKLCPFSHEPGVICLIPGTEYLVQAFPTRIRILDWERTIVHEEVLKIHGLQRKFTVMQDLERGCVTVFCADYRIHVLPDLQIVHQKNPGLPPTENQERLSFGSHKKQEWIEMRKRRDMREIFPLWFRLGSLLHLSPSSDIFPLLEEGQRARSEEIASLFEKIFLAYFEEMLVPRAHDTQFQGIVPENLPLPTLSPLYLLTQGATWIRSLFIEVGHEAISLLPKLPPECFAGRFLNISCGGFGSLDLEWTKKTVRRVIFRAEKDGEVLFCFQSHIKQFRLRETNREKGRTCFCGKPLEINKSTTYLLDRFQK